MINLNDVKNDTVSQGAVKKVFNGGKAGVVENVTIEVAVPDRVNAPAYDIVVIDENGGQLTKGYYVFSAPEDWDKERKDKAEARYGADLVNLIKITVGDITFPDFNSNKDMLDFVMKTVSENAKDNKFRVGVCYGFTESDDSPIGKKRWLEAKMAIPTSPWIESMDVDRKETQVALWSSMATERAPSPDDEGTTSTTSTGASDDLPF